MIKTAILLAAVAATSVNAYAAYPDFCPSSELAKFAPVLITNGADLTACQKASLGWTFIPPNAEPTTEQLTNMCGSQNCKNLLAAIQKLNPSDCFLSLSNNQQGVNVKKLAEEFAPFCELIGA